MVMVVQKLTSKENTVEPGRNPQHLLETAHPFRQGAVQVAGVMLAVVLQQGREKRQYHCEAKQINHKAHKNNELHATPLLRN